MKLWSRKGVRSLIIGLCLLVLAGAFCGCQTVRFYTQAIQGQYQIFAHQQPIDKLIADPSTPERLKNRLQVLNELRAFAETDLKLPVDGHYKKYVDLHRPYVVWNVQAAREFSMEPKTWWYPFLGKLKYRGYFTRPGATNYAAFLRERGYDVFAGGVTAYSTLGWFKDPVLNTFLFTSDSDLAETIFHELAHQRVFARGDTDFNEAFATTVGQEAARRWLRSKHDTQPLEAYMEELRAHERFVTLIMSTRRRLENVFGDERTEEGKVKATRKNRDLSIDVLRDRKATVYHELTEGYAAHRQEMGGHSYDRWFTNNLNNAKLNSVAAYYELVPAFMKLLEIDGNDLEKFFGSVDRLSKMSRKARHQWLATIAESKPVSPPAGQGTNAAAR